MKQFVLCGLAVTLAISPLLAFDDDNNNHGLQAIPSVFVGTAPGCAPSPGGSNIVTSAWLAGLGLPDNGSSNVTPSTPPNQDAHFGLLLSKNGATPDCAAAQATINGATGTFLTATTEFGFDYRNGGHCGAGAPRFNITTNDNITHFGGCAGGTLTPAPQDPLQWTRVRLTAAQFFPPLVPGTKIKSIGIVFDEGTDSSSVSDPNGIGLAVIDNIDVNGQLITRGPGNNDENDNNKQKDN
jgi:hypothetical protein